MNVRNDVTIISPRDKDELCAEFVIDDTSVPFVLNGVTQVGENYVLSFWMRSNSNALLKIGETELSISTEWERYKFSFTAIEENVKIFFNNKQKYYLYRAQLETGNVLTDWSPSTEDINASLEVKVDTDNLISEINASADIIRLTGDRIVIESTYFKVEEDGTVVASNMTITGTSQFISEQSEDSEDYTGSRVLIENGIIRIYDNQNRMASHNGFQSYYGGGDSEDYYSVQSALGVRVYTKEEDLLVSLTRNGIFGSKDTNLNWEGNVNLKQLNVNGYSVYGDKLISFKTTPYTGASGRTVSINQSMSKCQKGSGHVSINEQYYVKLNSSVGVSALLYLGYVPDMYIPNCPVAVSIYVNQGNTSRVYSGRINTEGLIEIRPTVAMDSGEYYIAVSGNYLINASNIQMASFSIVEQPIDKQVDVGKSVTFRVETDLEGNDTNTQFAWQTSSNNGSTWSNVKVHTPMANYSEYTISSVTSSQDGLWVRCTINRGDETVVSDIAVLTTTKQIYNVTYNLSNCSCTNTSSTAVEGESYETYIEIDSGYTTGTCRVTMGGSNITSSAFTSSSNRIYISKVTGNIAITYSANLDNSGGDTGGDEGGGDTGGGNENVSIKITKQPQDVQCYTTQSATFSIEAEGENLKFQWRVGTTQFSMSNYDATTTTANSSTLTIPANVTGNKSDKYVKCIVSNSEGSVTSRTAKLDYL